MTRRAIWLWILLAISGVGVLVHAIRRDIRYLGEYPGDLRNRVVGARLVEDGRDPYSHKWKRQDGIRYYDPENFIDVSVSSTTVTPLTLHFMEPVADLPEAQINSYWLFLEYLALAAITAIALLVARTQAQKQTVVAFVLLFLLSNGWKEHVNLGQCYIFIPLMAALFYACLRRNDSLPAAFLAGLFGICLVLWRPTALIFFLPFLLLVRRYPGKWLITFGVVPLLLGGWVLLNGRERGLWQDYKIMLDEQLKVHHALPYHHVVLDPDPKYTRWEGIDMLDAAHKGDIEPDQFVSEMANVFVIYDHLFKRPLSMTALAVLFLAVAGALLIVFYHVYRRVLWSLTLEHVTLFGYFLYMVGDFFSPALRRGYCTVQWIFPLLLMAAVLGTGKRAMIWWLLPGIILDIAHVPHVKMQNTIGEYLITAVLLVVCLTWSRNQPGFSNSGQKYCTSSG